MTAPTPSISTPRRPTALITGASGGIGLDLAREYARHGFDLVLTARSEGKLEQAAAELRGLGAQAQTVALDLGVAGAPQRLMDELAARGVQLDVLVNNAGFANHGPFAEAKLEQELGLIELNITSLTALTRLALPGMLGRGRGRILNVASTAAFLPGPLMATYYASKAYVLSFSEALAEELHGSGVAVTALCPGPTHSGFQERAGMQGSRLLRLGAPAMMTSAQVARAGFEGSVRGARVVIPGLVNQLQAVSLRFTPRAVVPGLMRRLHEATH